MRSSFALLGTSIWLALAPGLQPAASAEFPSAIRDVDWQPFAAQIRRVLAAGDHLGSPLAAEDRRALEALLEQPGAADSALRAQAVLDRHCLAGIHINPEMRVKVARGEAGAEMVEGGWRQFLVKVHNESGTTAELRVSSPQAQRLAGSPRGEIEDRWLDLMMFNGQPLQPTLGGLEVEYRIVQLYSRDAGQREAKLAFDVGQGTQDLGFRNEVDMLFECQPAREIILGVLDDQGRPTTATFEIRDEQGRVHPSQAKRLAPDFAFHPQVYRADGEVLRLPDGNYNFLFVRGPESIPEHRRVEVTPETRRLEFKVQRWIDPAADGWWSGDHHIHAAGCAHYTDPTEGVHAPDMMRHCVGEDLKVGANLTWGPCFDYQKKFFTGKIDQVSEYPYLLRYDIEVSGFGSHQSGHLCLLRLKDQMYPGGDSKHHWPTLGLNTLRWAKKQGAVTGPAHSGWGLESRGPEAGRRALSSRTSRDAGPVSADLPNYIVPPFNGIGANEYIVDVTHKVPGPDGDLVPAVDFISTVDTPYVWELNIWYHTLNCGFRTRISGETDFPCIYGERVGLGRSYVKLDGELNYDDWCEGIRQGRNYVGDGLSHLLEFRVNEAVMGEDGSELRLASPGPVTVKARVAALLDETPNPSLRDRPYYEKPYWHIERARLRDTREVPLEVIVNGYPVATRNIRADGELHDVSIEIPIEQSSWVALRILPSSHSNPVFVLVNDRPIRASKRSAQWCLEGVDRCWSQKERFIAPAEHADAVAAYDHARQAYRQILAESELD